MKSVVGFFFCAVWAMPLLLAPQSRSQPLAQPEAQVGSVRPNYVLGPGDQITIRASEVEEISSRPFRIDSEGELNLPILGKIHAGGLTVEQFEGLLTERLKTIVKNPQVIVNVSQFRSEPVFLLGAVKAPGIYNLQGSKTLVEMLANVGGTLPNASRIKVTRQMAYGRIPLPNSAVDPDGKVSTVEFSLASLTENMSPGEDIMLQPYDRVLVEKAELVYVNGEVNKVGGVELADRDSIGVTQLISMVGGLSKDADPEKARILRPVLNTPRRAEIPVDLKKILSGKGSDFPVMPNDVLYVPRAGHKLNWSTVGLIAIPTISAVAYVMVSKL